MNFPDYSLNNRNQLDHYPFRPAQPIVLNPQPVFNPIQHINPNQHTPLILISPQPPPFTQHIPQQLTQPKHILFISPHYQ
ncbi:RNA methyltransferase, partial [Staphylococcus epidermidis]